MWDIFYLNYLVTLVMSDHSTTSSPIKEIRTIGNNLFVTVPISNQCTLRKVWHWSKSLIIVITLVLLTKCDVLGFSMGSVNCDVMPGQNYCWVPPPYFVYICLIWYISLLTVIPLQITKPFTTQMIAKVVSIERRLVIFCYKVTMVIENAEAINLYLQPW